MHLRSAALIVTLVVDRSLCAVLLGHRRTDAEGDRGQQPSRLRRDGDGAVHLLPRLRRSRLQPQIAAGCSRRQRKRSRTRISASPISIPSPSCRTAAASSPSCRAPSATPSATARSRSRWGSSTSTASSRSTTITATGSAIALLMKLGAASAKFARALGPQRVEFARLGGDEFGLVVVRRSRGWRSDAAPPAPWGNRSLALPARHRPYRALLSIASRFSRARRPRRSALDAPTTRSTRRAPSARPPLLLERAEAQIRRPASSSIVALPISAPRWTWCSSRSWTPSARHRRLRSPGALAQLPPGPGLPADFIPSAGASA